MRSLIRSKPHSTNLFPRSANVEVRSIITGESNRKSVGKNRKFARLYSDHSRNPRLLRRRVASRVSKNAVHICARVCPRDYSGGTTRKFRGPIREKFIEFTKFDTGIILVLSRDFKRSRNPSFLSGIVNRRWVNNTISMAVQPAITDPYRNDLCLFPFNKAIFVLRDNLHQRRR